MPLIWGWSGCTPAPTPPTPLGAPWKGELDVETGDWDKLNAMITGARGKVIVLDVWPSWNEASTREITNLAKIQKKYGDKVVCIAVSCDVGFKEGETEGANTDPR